jgi:HlyD family secretion protein
MKVRPFAIKALIAVAAVMAAGAVTATSWHTEPREPAFQGWVEANFVFVGADEIGRVESLAVREGDTVAPGSPLFTVDADLQRDAVRQAEASLVNAQQAFNRAQELVKSGSGTRKEFDNASMSLADAEARLSTSRTRLARRVVSTPTAGTIQQVYFRPGEVAPAGRPVVSLLPPGNIKLRFFVPQGTLPRLAIGDAVRIDCDGCAGPLVARVSFISQKAEYTPPVIYSLEERAKLVFMIEARPERPELLRVGQPVRVAVAAHEAAP